MFTYEYNVLATLTEMLLHVALVLWIMLEVCMHERKNKRFLVTGKRHLLACVCSSIVCLEIMHLMSRDVRICTGKLSIKPTFWEYKTRF
ncbi:hypothetical protein [Pleurochrysis sp. endemic virus 2]|nr:hypothetical protein [Pleurochrysis sp. endemic virus 2]